MEQIPKTDFQIAQEWAKITVERLQKSIQKKGIGRYGGVGRDTTTGRFLAASAGALEQSISETTTPGAVTLRYLEYGKFVDMGVGRGQKQHEKAHNRFMAKAYGTRVGRAAKKWYSPTIYAEVNTLADLLQANYGDLAINSISQGFPDKIIL